MSRGRKGPAVDVRHAPQKSLDRINRDTADRNGRHLCIHRNSLKNKYRNNTRIHRQIKICPRQLPSNFIHQQLWTNAPKSYENHLISLENSIPCETLSLSPRINSMSHFIIDTRTKNYQRISQFTINHQNRTHSRTLSYGREGAPSKRPKSRQNQSF